MILITPTKEGVSFANVMDVAQEESEGVAAATAAAAAAESALVVSDELEVESIGNDDSLLAGLRDDKGMEEDTRPASAPQLERSNEKGGKYREGREILLTSASKLRKREVTALLTTVGTVKEIRRLSSTSYSIVFSRSRDAKAAMALDTTPSGQTIRVELIRQAVCSVSQDDSAIFKAGASPPPSHSRTSDIEKGPVVKEKERSRLPDKIKRKCTWCPRLWTCSLFLAFTCCTIVPFGNFLVIQTGFIYILLYPACLLECIWWLLYHFSKLCISLLRDLESLCCFCSREGCRPCRKKGISKHATHIAAYSALFLTVLVPILPLRLVVKTSDDDWCAGMIPTILGPMSPLRLTLLTTLGSDKNYTRVCKMPEFWACLRSKSK